MIINMAMLTPTLAPNPNKLRSEVVVQAREKVLALDRPRLIPQPFHF